VRARSSWRTARNDIGDGTTAGDATEALARLRTGALDAAATGRDDDVVQRRRSWWGWGYEQDALSPAEAVELGQRLGPAFGLEPVARRPPDPSSLSMRAPRVTPPGSLAAICSSETAQRASHAYGKAYRDVVRALAGRIDHPPDVVAHPRDEDEVAAVLDWCADAGFAVIPYGGGSSVVGGVEPDVGDAYGAVVTLDTGALDRVLEVDERSQAARIQAGALGPSLEEQLRPSGLTLRHFPQSFECSTLGGWIATRAGGHFATGPTHIDDLVEAVRVVTPSGILASRRLPASGAGPSPDRLVLGSEGSLGVITEAWVRVRRRPRWRAGGAATFADFAAGAAAVRALAQSGLAPSNCRLIDPVEAVVNGAGDGGAAVLIVGFESAEHPVGRSGALAAACVADHGGTPVGEWAADEDRGDDHAGTGGVVGANKFGSADAWRRSFLRAPYIRDALVTLGAMVETFETAVTWDRFDTLHADVTAAVQGALAAEGAGVGFVTCRLTHAYPDGAAPYFTVIAPARRGGELEQWDAVKAAASEALLAAGGTITHHHAVGRDHRRWYDRQRPPLFGDVLRAAKLALDPSWICNPGVLVDRR
jgi:alkyldihydroxyacetonephosphate synthase